MTNMSEGGGKKEDRGWPFGFGVGPSFSGLVLALRGGVGFFGRGWPFLPGVGVGRPLSWAGVGPQGLALLGVRVGTSFLLLGLPRGVGGWPFLLSGWGVGPSFSGLGWALPVGLALTSLGLALPSLGLGLALPSLGWAWALPGLALPSWGEGWPFLFGFGVGLFFSWVGVGPFGSGLALLSWTLGWPAFCGNNFYYNFKIK